MSRFTVAVTDNKTAKINVFECDCIFAGLSGDNGSHGLAMVEGNGFKVACAQNAALRAVEGFDQKEPMAKIARELIQAFDAEKSGE